MPDARIVNCFSILGEILDSGNFFNSEKLEEKKEEYVNALSKIKYGASTELLHKLCAELLSKIEESDARNLPDSKWVWDLIVATKVAIQYK